MGEGDRHAPLLGVLAASWRRQLRALEGPAIVERLIERTVALRDDLGLAEIGLDLGVYHLSSTDRTALSGLRERLAAERIVPTVQLGTLQLVADEDLSGPALRQAIGQLSVARALGSPVALFFFGYGGRVNREGRLRLAIEQVSALADAASERGIVVATEDYDHFTSDELLAIADAVGRDRFGINNDTGNWLLLGEDPLAATRATLHITRHAHIRDYVLTDGVYRSVPAGQGDVPIDAILDELLPLAVERGVRLSVEMDLDEGTPAEEAAATRESLRYLVEYARAWSDRA